MGARKHVCIDCATECGPTNICDDCRRTRTTAERAAQGLPPTIEDDATIRKVAALIAPTPTERRGAA